MNDDQHISVGRIVLYNLDGSHRPAIVVSKFPDNVANLVVFLDGPNDAIGQPDVGYPVSAWHSAVSFEKSGLEQGSWSWPS